MGASLMVPVAHRPVSAKRLNLEDRTQATRATVHQLMLTVLATGLGGFTNPSREFLRVEPVHLCCRKH